MLNEILGDRREILKLIRWIEKRLADKVKSYAILTSEYNGNGFTYIPQKLAEYYGLILHQITPYEITSAEELNKFIQTAISKTLYRKKKLILIEDITSFKSSYQKKLFELAKISAYPVIFTTTKLYALPKYFRVYNDPVVVYLKKPPHEELFFYLREKAKTLGIQITAEELLTICKEAKSIKSAINALYSKTPAIMQGCISYSKTVQEAIRGNDSIDVDEIMLYWLFDNVELNGNSLDFVKFICLLDKLFKSGFVKSLNSRYLRAIFSENVKFSPQIKYPVYFQHKASRIKQYKRICDFLTKFAVKLHCSTRTILNDYLYIIKNLAKSDEWVKSQILQLKMNEEELKLLGIKDVSQYKEKLESVKHKKRFQSVLEYF